MSDSSHFDEAGQSRMVDVGSKPITERMARATGEVRMLEATLDRIRRRDFSKGDVLEVARLAGIMAAKRTPDLIPLCHPLPLDAVTIDFAFPDATTLAIEAQVRCTARTGVEMEALTAVCIAALTVYDMCKSVDRGMQISAVRLKKSPAVVADIFKGARGQGPGIREAGDRRTSISGRALLEYANA